MCLVQELQVYHKNTFCYETRTGQLWMGCICVTQNSDIHANFPENDEIPELLYLMLQHVAELGRTILFIPPVGVIPPEQKDGYNSLRAAVKTMDSRVQFRHLSLRVVYAVLREYLVSLPEPLLVDNHSGAESWLRVSTELNVSLMVENNIRRLTPAFERKIKRLLQALSNIKYKITMYVTVMIRSMTYSVANKTFRQDQLIAIVGDLRPCFLGNIAWTQGSLDQDKVILVVCFMIRHARGIFGLDVDQLLEGATCSTSSVHLSDSQGPNIIDRRSTTSSCTFEEVKTTSSPIRQRTSLYRLRLLN